MGLGPYPLFSLSEARERARAGLKLKHDGVDPLEAKHAERRAKKLEASKAITFRQAAEKYIAAHKAGWRNGKHAGQWTSTLATYAEPIIGALPVSVIDTSLVLKVLEPIWTAKPETASRLRGRIESVLDWSKVRGYRDGENPARWKGHLDHLLPARGKFAKPKHHAALPWKGVGAFMVELRKQNGTAARALEFTILTAARTNETIGATWSEIDLMSKTWTIPGARMKAGGEHRVPLSNDAIAVLKEMVKQGREGFVFKSGKAGLSNMAMLKLVQDADRMNRPGVTVHGMRSAFRDWCAETGKPSDIAEAALAHTPGGKVIQAYQRGDLLDRRRALMTQWATFCAKPYVERSDNIVQIHGGESAAS